MEHYPTELLIVPTPTVAVVSDAPATAEAFAAALRAKNGARAHGTPGSRMRFETLPVSHVFPVKRRGHSQEYETYQVPGILRSGWLQKHHFKLPAIALLVMRITDAYADWQAIEMAVTSAVSQLRPSATSHGAELLVVLGGNAGGPTPALSPKPGGEIIDNPLAHIQPTPERLQALRRRAGIEGNGLAVVQVWARTPACHVLVAHLRNFGPCASLSRGCIAAGSRLDGRELGHVSDRSAREVSLLVLAIVFLCSRCCCQHDPSVCVVVRAGTVPSPTSRGTSGD
jgi:hypothetical protein